MTARYVIRDRDRIYGADFIIGTSVVSLDHTADDVFGRDRGASAPTSTFSGARTLRASSSPCRLRLPRARGRHDELLGQHVGIRGRELAHAVLAHIGGHTTAARGVPSEKLVRPVIIEDFPDLAQAASAMIPALLAVLASFRSLFRVSRQKKSGTRVT